MLARMDYCPEVAVLQSGFQLINKQAHGRLSDLSKDSCCQYVKVIFTSVEEICTGIEHDLDLETRELWQQKLHCLLFHTVTKNFYRKNEDASLVRRVPVQSPLDMLSELFPSFSRAFYFELMKQCSWTSYFLQCLQCLDIDTSSSLLCDLLSHCGQEPVTVADCNVMCVLSEKLLARCLCVPDGPAELCEELLKPLNQSQKYLMVVYPDVNELDNENISGDQVKDKSFLTPTKQNVGVHLFDEFVKNKLDLFDLILSNYEKQLDMNLKSPERVCERDLLQILVYLEIWYYLFKTGKDNSSVDWFVNNVFLSEDYNQSKVNNSVKHDKHLIYSLNFVLIECLCRHGDMIKLQQLIEKGFSLVSKLFKRLEKRSDNTKSWHTAQIVCGLSADTTVLLRMLYGIMGIDNTHEAYSHLEEIFHADMSVDKSELLLGETWNCDVTLEALMWRVTQRLPPYQVCIDRLLEEKCLQFWKSERLHHRMLQCSSLLSRADRISKLSNILTVVSQASHTRETTTSIINLIQTTFLQLSFPDQDLLVKEWYCSEKNYISEVMKEGIGDKVTNTFNKVTADLNNHVLNEILLLCIGDPVYVLNATLMLSIYNEQQAISCSQITRLVHKTCSCCHPVHHPDTSLIAYCIQRFLASQSLTSKQQNNFIVFVSEMMITKSKSSSSTLRSDFVLSPSEFILTTVLPSLSAEDVDRQSGNISCEFAMKLLLAALKASLEVIHDGDTHNVEVLPLLVTLAEIQHKCLVSCEGGGVEKTDTLKSVSVSMDSKSRPLVSMATKLNIRERINDGYALLIQLIEKQCMKVQHCDIVWMLDMTADLHLMVKIGLCDVMDACGCYEYREAWDVAMVTCLEDFVTNLVTILQFVAVDKSCMKMILERLQHVNISCDQLIVSLVQVLPLCSSSGFENIWTFIEELIASDSVNVIMMYKLLSTSYLPLLDYKVLRPYLYSSQILMYTMITLALTLKQKSWQEWSMLQSVITSYTGYLKVKCGQFTSEDNTTLLIYLCELFHHVGQVAVYLTVETMDVALILLLQVLTQYVSVYQQKREDLMSESFLKLRVNLENGLFAVIQRLPGSSDAKDMLCKKLRE